MKAIQVVKPGEIRVVETEKPRSVGAREVLVKTMAAGICGSDLHIYHGSSPFARYPRVIGHEAVGLVELIGSEVTSLQVGDRIVLEPIEYCGTCYACRINRPNICENLVVRGVMKDGGFQEYFTAFEDKLHKFPDSVDWDQAVMIEPFTIGAQVCFRAGVLKDDLVLIIGAGPTGMAVLENARLRGAVCVVADLNETRLAFAKEFGAHHVFNPQKCDLKAEITKLSKGMMCNVVVDAAGTPATLEQALDLTSVAARVVCLGFTDSYAKVSLHQVTRKELALLGSRLQTHQFKGAVEAFASSQLNIGRLITHRFDFTDVKQAFDLIENNPQEVGKVILRFYK